MVGCALVAKVPRRRQGFMDAEPVSIGIHPAQQPVGLLGLKASMQHAGEIRRHQMHAAVGRVGRGQDARGVGTPHTGGRARRPEQAQVLGGRGGQHLIVASLEAERTQGGGGRSQGRRQKALNKAQLHHPSHLCQPLAGGGAWKGDFAEVRLRGDIAD